MNKRNSFLLLVVMITIGILYSCDVVEKETAIPQSFNEVQTTEDEFSTLSNETIVIDFLKNDKIAANASISVGSPKHGVVEKATDRKFTYRPDSTYHGRDSLTYVVCHNSKCDSGKIVIIIKHPSDSTGNGNNCTIKANEDTASTFTNIPVTIPVLANDVACKINKISKVTAPQNGTAKINSNGTITYSPQSGFVGGDYFTYTICKGNKCSQSIVAIMVKDSVFTCDFTAVEDSLVFHRNDTTDINSLSIAVLSNDNLCDSIQSLEIVQDPFLGTAYVEDRLIIYSTNQTGPTSDSLKYRVCVNRNGTIYCKEAYVAILIQ